MVRAQNLKVAVIACLLTHRNENWSASPQRRCCSHHNMLLPLALSYGRLCSAADDERMCVSGGGATNVTHTYVQVVQFYTLRTTGAFRQEVTLGSVLSSHHGAVCYSKAGSMEIPQ